MTAITIDKFAAVLCALVLTLLAPTARADAAAFLDEVVAEYGGGTAPTAIHERGVTESTRRGKGPMERWWQAPDRFRIDIGYAGTPEQRLLRGAEAWQQGRPAVAAMHGALMLQAARMALPWQMRDNARQVVDLGEPPTGFRKPLRTLQWQVREGIQLIVEIDPDTMLVQRSRGILTINHSSMEFGTVYENYQRVDGRMVAMLERHFAMGQYIGSTTLESVEFPAVVPAPTFDPVLTPGNTVREFRPSPSLSGI